MALANQRENPMGLNGEHLEVKTVAQFKEKITKYFRRDDVTMTPRFHYQGIDVLENADVPEGEVWLVGRDGEKLQTYKV